MKTTPEHNERMSKMTFASVSKATAARDLTELVEKFKVLDRSGEVGAGTTYVLIGS